MFDLTTKQENPKKEMDNLEIIFFNVADMLLHFYFYFYFFNLKKCILNDPTICIIKLVFI